MPGELVLRSGGRRGDDDRRSEGRPGGEAPPSGHGVAGDAASWTSAYLRARELEGRLYPDAIVAQLPDVPSADPLRDEWRQRADSADRLVAYLGRLRRPLVTLDVGSGNGWLANLVAGLARCRVVGLEANEVELAQARRVFGGRSNLAFVSGDATTAAPPAERPNVILLASVVQYLENLPSFLRQLEGWLAPDGELHILDSPFYRTEDVPAARERSRQYYSRLGVPEMAEIYHAHDWRSLEGFAFELLYRPDSPRARFERRVLGRPRSPFPWIRIRPNRSDAGPSVQQ